jgi:hypothetical protein
MPGSRPSAPVFAVAEVRAIAYIGAISQAGMKL